VSLLVLWTTITSNSILFMKEPGISLEDCPLEWWRSHGSYGTAPLAQAARYYLGIPAASTMSEVTSSEAAFILDKRRGQMDPAGSETRAASSLFCRQRPSVVGSFPRPLVRPFLPFPKAFVIASVINLSLLER